MKFSFFAAMSQEIQFEYTTTPPMASLNAWGAERTGLKETVMDPVRSAEVRKIISQNDMDGLVRALRSTTPAQPVVRYECPLNIGGEARWSRIIARATWSADEPPRYTGAIGKATDIHDSRMKLEKLERTMDAIRSKYGREAVTVAALTRPPEPQEDPADLPF